MASRQWTTTQFICDRCGTEHINQDDADELGWVRVGLRAITNKNFFPMQSDLCPGCAGTLKHWLGQNTKGEIE